MIRPCKFSASNLSVVADDFSVILEGREKLGCYITSLCFFCVLEGKEKSIDLHFGL